MNFYTNVQVVGDNILYRGYDNGIRVKTKIPYQPTLYLKSKNPSSYKTIFGENLVDVQPGTIRESKQFIEKYKDVPDFKIYGNIGWIYQYISDTFTDENINYDIKKLKIGFIDIENESENGFASPQNPTEKINVITIRVGNKKYVFTHQEFKYDDPNIIAHIHDNESDMLLDFIRVWQDLDLDVITGWNIRSYDVPYIVNRITTVLDEDEAKKLSPWKFVKEEFVSIRGKDVQTFKISGISILDYYELYRKYTYSQLESYKLDHVAFIELGRNKHDYSEYATIKDFYNNNFQKFVEYNINDVDLVVELDEKLNLIALQISVAYTAKVNFEDVYSQVKTWDAIIFNFLKRKNIIIPPKNIQEKNKQFAGAYVKDPMVGMFDWVVSFDVASMYPNIIRMLNISPETISDKKQSVSIEKSLEKEDEYLLPMHQENYSFSLSGNYYKNNVSGFLPELVTKFYDLRKLAKNNLKTAKKNLEHLLSTPNYDKTEEAKLRHDIVDWDMKQQTGKIAINSLYGVLGSEYFRFYDLNMAESVTLTGQFLIRYIQKQINKFLNNALKTENVDYVIASDTDSVMINLNEFVKKYSKNTEKNKIIDDIDTFCKQYFEPLIQKQIAKIYKLTNSTCPSIQMVRDCIADRGFWTAKKRYALNVYDSEGVRYKNPKMKIMGIEVQRSSTPHVCRDRLKKCIEIILTQNENVLIDYIDDFKKKFNTFTAADVAFPRGVSDMVKYYSKDTIFKKGTPIAVKGALIYNNFLEQKNLTKKYTKITSGDKIKFMYLKLPNPVKSKVISFSGELPKELDLHAYIDYDEQFEKSFLHPLNTILKVIGWNFEKKNTLENFFC